MEEKSAKRLDSANDSNTASARYLEYQRRLAKVIDPIYPGQRGRIRFQGSFWPALCVEDIAIEENAIVYVVGFRNITCVVEVFGNAQ